MTCPHCGTDYKPDDNRFCSMCGLVSLPSELFGRLPVPERVRELQEERQDFAEREV